MNGKQMARGFNRWMREFIKNPKKFERTAATVARYRAERKAGKRPSYGDLSVDLLRHYAKG